MYDNLTFLSERQNLLLLEKLFSSTNYKDLSDFLSTFNFKSPGSYLGSGFDSNDLTFLLAGLQSKKSSNIIESSYGNAGELFSFRLPNEVVAVFIVYPFAGPNNEPVSIIYYFLPLKIINFPYMRLCRDISSCIDINSHKVYKNSCHKFRRIYPELNNCKAVIRIESNGLDYFIDNRSLQLYKLHVWLKIWSASNDEIKHDIDLITPGSFVTSIRLSLDGGKIKSPSVLSNTSNQALSDICLCSLTKWTYIDPMPQNARDLLSSDYLDLKFSFTVSEDKQWALYLV